MTKEGYKQILLAEEVYEVLKKRKGKQSFSSFIKNLLDMPIIEHVKGETEVSMPIDVKKVSVDTQYRYHGCYDCNKTEFEVEACRVRMGRYELYKQKCPREMELTQHTH